MERDFVATKGRPRAKIAIPRACIIRDCGRTNLAGCAWPNREPSRLFENWSLIKVAARVTEMVTRIKVALPSAFPYQASFTHLAGRVAKLPP
jgi:hypothetical protein